MGGDTTTTNERYQTDHTASFHRNSSSAMALDKVPVAQIRQREKSNSDLENVWRRGSYQDGPRGSRDSGAEEAKKILKKKKKEEKR